MGMNLQSCCHRCKVKRFHYRGEEHKTLLPFYDKHYECMKINPRNIETLEDQMQEADWMCGQNGYPEDEPNGGGLSGGPSQGGKTT